MSKFNRKKVIERLVDDSIDTALNENSWLKDIFKTGFKGFENMSKDELLKELNDRDIEF